VTRRSDEAAASRSRREAAVRRLLELATAGQLTSAHVRLAASSVGVAERTVWRWLDRARSTGMVTAEPRRRFAIDEALRERLAYWRGNVSALHRELVAAAAAGGAPAPSMATLQRAVARDRPPEARGGHGATHRNAAWEADCFAAPIEVDAGGRLVRPWITWFVDSASSAVCGTVVTPQPPGRESILTALRAAIVDDEPGGLPEKVRVDPANDLLSNVVGAALGVFAVSVEGRPRPTGSLEPLREALANLLADTAAMTYEAFVVELLDWVRWWNTEHRMDALGGRTPLDAWLADPRPLSTVSAADLRLFEVGPVRQARAALPDPGQATTLDGLVERLRLLKVWAGDPSYETIKDRVNEVWAKAARPASELAAKTTVVDAFRLGRRRLNTDLVVAVVRALHPDVPYVAQWRQALQVVGGESRAAAQVRVQDTLPPGLAAFTGRAGELDRLRRVLSGAMRDGVVVTAAIEGMAGVGKTELAVHAGQLLAREQPFDRVLFVNLRGFHPDPAQPPADPAAVLDGFLRLLGVSGQKIPHDLDARAALYRRLLAGTRALVLLDNAADADQVRPLLPEAAGCPVMVTSRRGLAELHPATRLTVDVFTPDEAVRFLVRSAAEVPVGDDPGAAARIAERCGRLPLALGLVAGHLRAKPGWTLTDHADWLDQRHGDRRLDSGVELALRVSYQDLPVDRRRLLRLLALHPGHDVDAYAAAALAGSDLEAARSQLRHLCGDHLLQRDVPDRYTFHDLIRAYATTRAHDEDRLPDRRAALTRLFDYYLATTATAMNTLHPAHAHLRPEILPASTPTPPLGDPDTALAWLETERPTLVAVAAYTAAAGWPTHTTRLSRVLHRYLQGGHPADAVTVHGHAHDAARGTGDPTEQAHALTDLGVAYWRLGRHEPANEHLQQALDLFRHNDERAGQARTLNSLGIIADLSGHYRTATEHYERALTLLEQAGDRDGEARTLTNLSIVEGRLGQHRSAIEHCTRALALAREAGDRDGEAAALNNLGDAELRSGRHGPAGEHLQQALTLFRQLGNSSGEAWTLDLFGTLQIRLGGPTEATEHLRRALTIFHETGDRDGEASAHNGLGEAAHAAGHPADALHHHTAAHTIATDIGSREQQARADTGLGHAHRAQGNPALAREHFGHALTLCVELGMPEADEIRTHLATLDDS
jgi:tetratricopeptide (TPR) repeat protein